MRGARGTEVEHHRRMSRDLLPAPEAPRPERFILSAQASETEGVVIAEDRLGRAGSCCVIRSGSTAELKASMENCGSSRNPRVRTTPLHVFRIFTRLRWDVPAGE